MGALLRNALASAALGLPAVCGDWENSTTLRVYRVTPSDVEGLADMDSADSAGDLAFGLSQLLLPEICQDPMNNPIWCGNRKFLTNASNTSRIMVYRSFNISVRLPFGAYARCNPDHTTGVFSCCSENDPQGPNCPQYGNPNQNQGNACGDFQEHQQQFLSGTKYHHIRVAGNNESSKCCGACIADGPKCSGLQWHVSGNGSNTQLRGCSLVANGSLVPNSHGQFSASKNPPQPPNYCQGVPGADYVPHGTLLLDGTKYKTIKQGHTNDPNAFPGGPLSRDWDASQPCCKVCNDDGNTCQGMQWLYNSSGGFCHLITNGSLVANPGGINSTSKRNATLKGAGMQQSNRKCWNQDMPPNMFVGGGIVNTSSTFKPFCDEDKCGCPAVEQLAVGWQPAAMCSSAQFARPKRRLAANDDPDTTTAATLSQPPPQPVSSAARPNGPWPEGPSYWKCKAAVAKKCGGWNSWDNSYQQGGQPLGTPGRDCSNCAFGSLNWDREVQAACNSSLIQQACSPPDVPYCTFVVQQLCQPGCCHANCSGSAQKGQCQKCEQCALHQSPEAMAQTAAANCSFDVLFTACGDPHAGGGPGVPPRGPEYWACENALRQNCFNNQPPRTIDRRTCMDCAVGHLQSNDRSMFYCNMTQPMNTSLVAKVCTTNEEQCKAAVKTHCAHLAPNCSSGNATQCQMCTDCAHGGGGHSDARLASIAANCSEAAMSEACGQQEQNPWQQDQPYYQKWQDDFACKLSGNWYSTQKVSECKGEPDDSCWWKLNSPVRGEVVVNASCVDGRVTKHVRSKHPECWAACGDQADNSSSLCPTSCVFNTILGNASLGFQPMTREEVLKPFEDAFLDPAAGGCPRVPAAAA